MTPNNLVNMAARRVNIIAHNETLSASELQDGLDNLNSMLSMYSMEPLLAENGIVFPLAADDYHTGMDDQVEYALVDLLAVRLAGVYQLLVAPTIAMSAERAERNLKAWNIKPIYSKSDLVLRGLSR